MITTKNVNDLIGADVYGSGDDKIGSVGQVYVDNDTQNPAWITVKTGLFGSSESFAPLDAASFDGTTVRIPFDKSFVKDAPRMADDGALSHEEEGALYSYYGNGGVLTADTQKTDAAATDTPAADPSDAMTRSEEQLHVGTETVEAGRARLSKHVVIEMQSVTVPVSHEEVTLTREPITDANITDANITDATSGPALTEGEHEVVLTEERVVVGKQTVPVERVALGTETVTEQQQVTEEVAHEEIEFVEPGSETTRN